MNVRPWIPACAGMTHSPTLTLTLTADRFLRLSPRAKLFQTAGELFAVALAVVML